MCDAFQITPHLLKLGSCGKRGADVRPRFPSARMGALMKYATDRPCADPEKAARRLMEHAQAFEPPRRAGSISRRSMARFCSATRATRRNTAPAWSWRYPARLAGAALSTRRAALAEKGTASRHWFCSRPRCFTSERARSESKAQHRPRCRACELVGHKLACGKRVYLIVLA
jgi:hypothetical protein